MILTVDIGNSRIKLSQWQAGVILARKVSSYVNVDLISTLDELFSDADKPSRILAVCVADEKKRQALSDWVRQHWQLPVEFMKTDKRYKNIVNAYDDPQQHGADRWAAIVAGHQLFPTTPICVISAGTAITFDLVDEKGAHLGGYILPSYVTMHNALLDDTANVASDLSMQFIDSGKIPDNTDDAVNDGLHKLLQAGVREICSSAKNILGEPMKIIITGGFAQTILSYPSMPEMLYQPDLVMQGLYNIMTQAQNQAES